MRTWLFPALFLGLLLALSACTESDDPRLLERAPGFRHDGTLSFLRPDGSVIRTIAIEIADTEAARARGLMQRRSMDYDQGMLFIFPDVSTSGFWMKNTPLPLDIVFVGPDSQVVSIAERTTPFSEESILPEAPKQYVVEVRAGFAERFGLTDSTRIRWERL